MGWYFFPPTLYYVGGLYRRRVWEAAPYERKLDLRFESVGAVLKTGIGHPEKPGDSHASVRAGSE